MRYSLQMSSNQPVGDEIPPPSPVLGYAGLSPPPMVAVVWCRLFALWLLANGLSDVASVFGFFASYLLRPGFRSADMFAELIPPLFPLPIFLLVAWYCWSKAPTLARRMAGGLDPGPSRREITSNELLHIVLIGIGIYLLTEGIPGIARLVYYAITTPRNGPPGFQQIDAVIFGSIIRSGLGVWLILGTRGIAQLLRRHSGRSREEPETTNPKSE
jgi:hypothetical protein